MVLAKSLDTNPVLVLEIEQDDVDTYLRCTFYDKEGIETTNSKIAQVYRRVTALDIYGESSVIRTENSFEKMEA